MATTEYIAIRATQQGLVQEAVACSYERRAMGYAREMAANAPDGQQITVYKATPVHLIAGGYESRKK